MKKISFVIPCYGSELTIKNVIEEIRTVMLQKSDMEYEIITINDYSPDNVYLVLRELASELKELKVLNLAKNFGKHSALMAGYAAANGDVIVNLDDDGQCPLDKLWELVKPLENDYDIAIASYSHKKQSDFKNFGSKINDMMAVTLLNKPKSLKLSNFCAIKRYVADEIVKYNNPYAYLDGLFLRTTRNIINVQMEERERFAGKGNYTFLKSLSLWMNGFTAFSVKPLRIATILGVVCAAIGFIFGAYTVIHKLINPDVPMGYSSIMAALLFIGGMIMLMLGLIGEYIGRMYISMNNSPQYVVRDRINFEEKDNIGV